MVYENIIIIAVTLILGFFGYKIYDLVHLGTIYLKTKAETEWAKEALDFLDYSFKKAIEALQATARKEIDKDFAAKKLGPEEYAAAKSALMTSAISSIKTSKADTINYLKSRFGCTDAEIDTLLKQIGEGHLEEVKKS